MNLDGYVHLQPKQADLCDLIAATGDDVPTILGAGGAKGGGKSAGARSICLTLATELGELYPGIIITVVRRVYRDLKDNHIDPILRGNPSLYTYWRAGDEQLNFGGKAVIAYRYAQNEEDVKRKFLGGYESAIIIIDEAQQFSQREIEWISTAARWTGKAGIPAGLCKTVLLFNPGGTSGPFIRRIFWLRKYEGREKASNYAFIHIFGWDNYEWFRSQVDISEKQFYQLPSMCPLGSEHLGHDYCCRFHLFVRETSEGRKYNAYPASIRMGYLLGNFEHFEGQYFAGVWDEQRCCLTASQVDQLIAYWHIRWMSGDWGYRHHASIFWFAALRCSPSDLMRILGIESEYPLDLVICYRELVVAGRAEYDLAADIVARTPVAERERMQQFVMDTPGAFHGMEHTVAEQMDLVLDRGGLPRLRRPDKKAGSRIDSARAVYDGFRRSSSMRSPNPPREQQPTPLLLIGPECPVLQASIPMLIADDNNLEDVLKLETMEDDVFDGFKYGVGYYRDGLKRSPVEVRRKAVYDSIVTERTTETMTNVSMAMRKFNEAERRSSSRVKRRR